MRKIWLNPEKVLREDDLKCGECARVMPLLMQVYTPEDQPLEAHHRAIYVFCCKNGQCMQRNPLQSYVYLIGF